MRLNVLSNENTDFEIEVNHKIAPFEVEIDPTNTCNQDCYYCNVHDFRKDFPDKASTEDYVNLIRGLPDTVGKIVFSGGGEPTVHKDASILIEEACKKNAEVGLITNGTMLYRLNLSENNRPDWMGIDIDAVNDEDYYKIRKHKFKYVLKNVKEEVPKIKKYGTKLTFKYLITDYNNTWEHFTEAIDFAVEHGFDEFFARIAHFKDGHVIEPITDWDDVHNKLDIYCKEKKIVFLSAFAKEKDFRNTTEPIEKCFGPMLSVIFCADGYTYWCTEHRGVPEYRLGNWIKDGYNSIFKKGLLKEMDNFRDCHSCSLQCKYFYLKNRDGSWKGINIDA
jgi:MoaA/NifB/PqqE/SkfB family radical SAM enzyme